MPYRLSAITSKKLRRFILRGGTSPPSLLRRPLRNRSAPQTQNPSTTSVVRTWLSEKSFSPNPPPTQLRPSAALALSSNPCHHDQRWRKSNQVPCSPIGVALGR